MKSKKNKERLYHGRRIKQTPEEIWNKIMVPGWNIVDEK